MVLVAGARSNHIQLAVLDQCARHPRLQRNSIQVLLRHSALRTPIPPRPNHILEQARKRRLALLTPQTQVAVISAVLEFPLWLLLFFLFCCCCCRGRRQRGAGQTFGALEDRCGLAGTMPRGHDLGDDGMDIVAIGIHAKPHGKDNDAARGPGEVPEHAPERPWVVALEEAMLAHIF